MARHVSVTKFAGAKRARALSPEIPSYFVRTKARNTALTLSVIELGDL
jgi:hypothetical protein